MTKSSAANTMQQTHGTQQIEIHRYQQAQYSQQQDSIAVETPVCLSYNDISHAVMLATPQDLEDFAIGFSITEGIADSRNDIYDINIVQREQGTELAVTLSSRAFAQLKDKKRTLNGRTGCGICGKENLAQLALDVNPVNGDFVITAEILQHAMSNLAAAQNINNITGSVHAAAWCDLQGNIQILREDVGRHNALDKLMGALSQRDTDPNTGFVVITSRISYELIVKATALGVSLMAAISAPTSLAVELATQANLTLIGFTRNDSYVIYNHPQRITHNQAGL